MAWTKGAGGEFYPHSVTGRLFSTVTNMDAADTTWFGDLAYDETTPILMLRNGPLSTRKAILHEATFYLTNVPGDEVNFYVVADVADRYAPFTGVQRVPDNNYIKTTNEGGFLASLEVYDEAPTAIPSAMVVGSAPRRLEFGIIPANPGNFGGFELKGGILLPPGSGLGIYAWSAVVGPIGRYSLKWIEEAA
jgi:hypothetical protein